MSLKELTSENHKLAESTAFMKAVFAKTLPQELWIDWTFQKLLFYSSIEIMAAKNMLLTDLEELPRSFLIYQDYYAMHNRPVGHDCNKSTVEYNDYLKTIQNDPDKIMAHLYTWHMGDLFGGQMIKKIVPGSHLALEFNNSADLIKNIRSKLNDSMAEEANIAFTWAIKMMREYDSRLG